MDKKSPFVNIPNMRASEKNSLEIAWMLGEIRRQSGGDSEIFFELHYPDSKIPSHEKQRLILKKIEKEGGIKIKSGTLTPSERIIENILNEAASIELDIFWERFVELEKEYPEPKTNLTEKPRIVINRIKGIYRDDKKGKAYEISGARKEIVFLLAKHPLSKTKLEETTELKDLYGDIREINEKFRKFSGFSNDLILRSDSSGYRLNSEDFVIEMEA